MNIRTVIEPIATERRLTENPVMERAQIENPVMERAQQSWRLGNPAGCELVPGAPRKAWGARSESGAPSN
ncbi:MAG: hypothetical protein NVS2B17_22090 [Candidatus Velthaea sp.]